MATAQALPRVGTKSLRGYGTKARPPGATKWRTGNRCYENDGTMTRRVPCDDSIQEGRPEGMKPESEGFADQEHEFQENRQATAARQAKLVQGGLDPHSIFTESVQGVVARRIESRVLHLGWFSRMASTRLTEQNAFDMADRLVGLLDKRGIISFGHAEDLLDLLSNEFEDRARNEQTVEDAVDELMPDIVDAVIHNAALRASKVVDTLQQQGALNDWLELAERIQQDEDEINRDLLIGRYGDQFISKVFETAEKQNIELRESAVLAGFRKATEAMASGDRDQAFSSLTAGILAGTATGRIKVR